MEEVFNSAVEEIRTLAARVNQNEKEMRMLQREIAELRGQVVLFIAVENKRKAEGKNSSRIKRDFRPLFPQICLSDSFTFASCRSSFSHNPFFSSFSASVIASFHCLLVAFSPLVQVVPPSPIKMLSGVDSSPAASAADDDLTQVV